MTHEVFIYSCIFLIGFFFSSISQVMLKMSAQKKYPSRLKEYLNPLVITAYLIFGMTTFISIYAYKVVPLSMGPILESTSYIYATIFGAVFFKERVGKQKIGGLALILLGIGVYALAG